MAVKTTILMTVFNRPPRVLWNTLHALRKNDLTNCEVLIVDDGSTVDYADQKSYASQYEMPVRWLRIEADEYPGAYRFPHKDGGYYNNCAYATNRGIAAAEGSRLMFLSSDCMLPKHAVAHAKRCGDHFWLASVMDQATNQLWVGDHRIITVNWFASAKREHIEAVGGFDEEYMNGMGYEDADFGARLGLYLGHIVFDMATMAIHQSHPPLAYTDGRDGFRRSGEYTERKWGGPLWATTPGGPLELGKYRDGDMIRVNVALRSGFPDPLAGARFKR